MPRAKADVLQTLRAPLSQSKHEYLAFLRVLDRLRVRRPHDPSCVVWVH